MFGVHKIGRYILLFFVAGASLNISSEEISLIVEGVGDSKANAIIDAQRNALRISYGEFISTNLTTLDNQLTKNETVNLVSGTVKNYKVLSETVNDFSEPPITEVLAQITINKGQLVSFAKVIGDSVEVQGRLYGAELRLQEINNKNEAVAMQHLVRKAEIISNLFDYKISVGDPKKGLNLKKEDSHFVLGQDSWNKNKTFFSQNEIRFVPQDSFFIYSSMSLLPNKNFFSLMNAITETLSSIALTPNEIKKYKELNIPYHRLDILKIVQPDCEYYLGPGRRMNSSPYAGIGNYPNLVYEKHIYTNSLKKLDIVDFIEPEGWFEREKAISKIDGIKVLGHTEGGRGHILTCTAAEVDSLYLRANTSIQRLEEINDLINKRIFEYQFHREAEQSKKLVLPRPYPHLSYYPSSSYDFFPNNINLDKPSTKKDELLIDMVRENAKGYNVLTLSDLKRPDIVENLKPPEDCSTYLLCYKDFNLPEYAHDINRLYSNTFRPDRRKANGKKALFSAVGLKIDEGIFWDDRYWLRNGPPNSQSDPSRSAYQKHIREYYYEMRKEFGQGSSRASQVFYKGRLSLSDNREQIFGQFRIYPVGSTFAKVNYEDIVTSDELSKITRYSVEVVRQMK